MPHGWEGPRIRLVPLERSLHLAAMTRWRQDPDIAQYLAGGWRLKSGHDMEAWFTEIEGKEDEIHFAIETLEGEPIGWTALRDVDLRLGHCETASVIGDAALRGHGLGQEAAHLRAYYAFDIVGLRVLYSEHYPYNTATQRMMEALGAHVWGIKPEANFKNGRYTDVVCTFLRRDMWRRPDWLPELT